MLIEQAAQGFAAMGSEQRLKVLRALIRAEGEGLSIGELQERTEIAPTTLAHHLRFLTGAGLIEQQKIGRSTLNHAAYDVLRTLAEYILDECCADVDSRAANDG